MQRMTQTAVTTSTPEGDAIPSRVHVSNRSAQEGRVETARPAASVPTLARACDRAMHPDNGVKMTTQKTTAAAAAAAADAAFDAWLETIMSEDDSGHVKGNADARMLDTLTAFVESGEPTLYLTLDSVQGWTFTRRGKDADEANGLADVKRIADKIAGTMPDNPVYVGSYRKGDDSVAVYNLAHSAKNALEAHARLVKRAVNSLKNAQKTFKGLSPNASPEKRKNAEDSVNEREARVKVLKSEAIRLMDAAGMIGDAS